MRFKLVVAGLIFTVMLGPEILDGFEALLALGIVMLALLIVIALFWASMAAGFVVSLVYYRDIPLVAWGWPRVFELHAEKKPVGVSAWLELGKQFLIEAIPQYWKVFKRGILFGLMFVVPGAFVVWDWGTTASPLGVFVGMIACVSGIFILLGAAR